MAALINATKVALLVLSVAGFYLTWYLLLNNGSTEYMDHIRDFGPRVLPGTNEPLKTEYGFKWLPAVDYQFTVLTLFFWEQVDGSRPDASLYCFHLASQILAGWPLLMLEGMRHGNRWRVVSFIAIWGLLVQNLSYAVIIPIYCILHLSTSPTVMATQVADEFAVDLVDIDCLPWCMIFGFVLPSVLMSLHAPSICGHQWKQTFMAIWQVFPVWMSLSHQLIASLTKKAKTVSQGNPIGSLRNLYVLLLVAAGITQVSTFTLVGVSTAFPSLFAPEFAGIFNLSKVFIPRGITPSTKMDSIGSGALMLMQYDQLIGSTAIDLWASILFLQARRRARKESISPSLVFNGAAAMLLAGPLGYAIACIWARDEIIFGDKAEKSRKAE